MSEMIDKDTGKLNFPTGCQDCKEVVSCFDCNWVDNSWKYDEINYYLTMAMWSKAGFDLNRIKSLQPNDFIKTDFAKRFLLTG